VDSGAPVTGKEQCVGIVEVDESFFGQACVRGRPDPRKQGRRITNLPVLAFMIATGASTLGL